MDQSTTCKGNLISLRFDQHYLDSLLPPNSRFLEVISDALNAQGLQSESDYRVILPVSHIEHLEMYIIRFAKLFRNPMNSDEPGSLNRDGYGNMLHLSPEQMASVRREAILRVPSRLYPDQYHVWKLNCLLQVGSENIKLAFEISSSSSLNHLIVAIPDNLFSNQCDNWSVRRGMINITTGLAKIVSSFVGLIEKIPRHSRDKILYMVEIEKQVIIASSLKRSASNLSPHSFFDDRLYDEKLTERLQTVMNRINYESSNKWCRNFHALRAQILKDFELSHSQPFESNRLIDKIVHAKETEHLNNSYLQDEELSSISPGYGSLLANRSIALLTIKEFELSLLEKIIKYKQEVLDKLTAENPILSRIDGWREPRVSIQVQNFDNDIRWQHLAQITDKLNDMGLYQEANTYRENLRFQRYDEQNYKDQFSKEMIPLITVQFYIFIWDPKKYIPIKINDKYQFRRHMNSTISSDQLFWRWRLLINRVYYHFWNGLYIILIKNLWEGPHGLRAFNLFETFFHPDKEVYMENGIIKVIVDERNSTYTYIGNLSNVQSTYYEACHDFESAQDEGILGKDISRPFHRTYHMIIRILGTSIILFGQPILTIINILLSTVLVLTSVAWSILSGFSMLLFDAIIVDRGIHNQEYQIPGDYFPVISHFIWYILIAGIGQITFKLIQSIVIDFPFFLLKGIFTYLTYGFRTVYDSALRFILKSRMRVPGVDSFWAKRIQGPGLSSNYYYQIEPEIAILALQVYLELEEINIIKMIDIKRIKKPIIDFDLFFYNIGQPLQIDNSNLPIKKELILQEIDNLKMLSESILLRRKKLDDLISHEIDRSTIKLTQESLDQTLTISYKIVNIFYNEHLVKRMNEDEITKFWIEKILNPSDFIGLTKYFYQKAFGGDFLKPLQKTDNDFIIEVKQPSLRDALEHYPLLVPDNIDRCLIDINY